MSMSMNDNAVHWSTNSFHLGIGVTMSFATVSSLTSLTIVQLNIKVISYLVLRDLGRYNL